MRPRLSIFSSRALALVIFLAAYAGLGRVYEYAAGQNVVSQYNRQRFEEFYATPPDSLDWVFLGSSHAYCTFDPADFDAYGVRAYQLGMPSQLADGSYYTLRAALTRQRPRLAVLDVYWVLEQDFDVKPMETLLQVMDNDALQAEYLRDAPPWNEKLKFYLKPIRYQADFFAYANHKLLNVIDYRLGLTRTYAARPGTESYQGRGYVSYTYEMTERQLDEAAAAPALDLYGWEMSPRQALYLDRIVALCAREGIALALVTAPVSNVYFNRVRDYDAFHDAMAGYAEANGLPYLDFNLANQREGLFADSHFYDVGHLNDAGAEVAGAYFMAWWRDVR